MFDHCAYAVNNQQNPQFIGQTFGNRSDELCTGGTIKLANNCFYDLGNVFRKRSSPLVFDLLGNGFEYTSVEEGVVFDLDKDGKAEKDTTGGILPDIVLTDSQKVDITYTLYAKNLLFDYSTRYYRAHPTVASPLEFELTDAEIEDFIQFLDEKHFSYETETSKYYEDMLRMAHHEDIDTTLLKELEDLKERLKPSFRDAIMRNLDEVKQALGAEIMQRYYYQKGRIAFLLRYDKELKRAKEEILK